MAKDARQLTAAIGVEVAAMRKSAGMSQDELAMSARKCGLAWTRSSVAALETGRRDLSASELLLLPLVLHVAFKKTESLDSLLSRLGEVRLTATATAHPVAIHELLTGDIGGVLPREFTVPLTKKYQKSLGGLRDWKKTWPDIAEYVEKMERIWPDASLFARVEAEEAAAGEAEQKTARRLVERGDFKSMRSTYVSCAAFRLWGRSLTSERDGRVQDAATGEEGPRTLQALRGRVTRELEVAIAEVLREADIDG